MVLFKENEGFVFVGVLVLFIVFNDGKDIIGIVFGMEILVFYKFEGGYCFGVYWGFDYYENYKK